MSFLSGIVEFGKSAVNFISGNGVWSSLARTAILAYAVNKLSSNALKDNNGGTNNIDEGVRLQAKPDAKAKIPVLYGSAFFGGNITDAAMTNANKTMWYSLVLAEKTGNVYSTGSASSYTFNNIYWNNQRIVFRSDGVTADYTVDTTGVIDRSISGLVKVYCYAGNSSSSSQKAPSGGTITPANAYSLFPNWASGTHAMDGLIFAIVSVDYNREKNVTGIGDMLFQVTNSMIYPGDVIYDYLTNTTYGAGIDSGDILTADIAALNTYSQDNINYDDQGTGAETLADRYQINGLIDTANPVLQNAEAILSAAASWLSYDTHAGKWGVVVNKQESSIASFDDSNVIGNINLSGTGLKELYNEVSIEFPHRELRDSADYYNIALNKRNANEETNSLNLKYDIINEPIQAQMLGLIELKQSRLDRVIQFQTDFSYYNLKAGDVIDITDSRFGFTNEKFRIVSITETEDNGGALMMKITALQYDDTIYTFDDLYRYTRSDEDGIITIGSIGVPGTPVVSKIEVDARPRIEVTSTAPTGVVEGIEYWLTTDVNELDDADRSYVLIGTKRPAGGGVFTSGTSVTLEYPTDTNNFYIKTRGFNTTTVGPFSNVSGLVEFESTQVTDAISPDTGVTGGLLGALALVELLNKLGGLFPTGSGDKSIFDRIFDIFKDETGVDLVGQASEGSLAVEAAIETKSDGTSLGATTASYDFQGIIDASGSGDITVKLEDGVEDKDIIAWNKELGQWQRISGCGIACDFENVPPDIGDPEPCSLTLASTVPASNFTLGDLCQSVSNVPYQGSYFMKFNIQQPRLGAEAVEASSIVAGTKYTIAKANNTDFTWWGAADNNVGTVFTAVAPATMGRLTTDIIVGKRYKIKTVGTTDWAAIGADVDPDTLLPTVGDSFTATATGSGTGVVEMDPGLGWVYPPGETDSENTVPYLAPLSAGIGNIYLYGTDGKLEQTLAESQLIFHSDVVEIPFAPRQPGKDYYILMDEGLIQYCSCESQAVESPTDWTFRTSLVTQPPATPPTRTALPGTSDVNYPRQKLSFTYTPMSALCSDGTPLILSFSQKVKKGSGSILIRNRATKTVALSYSVSGATIALNDETNKWDVSFGDIAGLSPETYYDVEVPQGLLVSDYPASTSTTCDVTTNIPAGPANPNIELTWGFRTETPLAIRTVEVCREENGTAKVNSNVVITFNKAFKPAASNAYVYIKDGAGNVHQKFDLNGTFESDKYGTSIYGYTANAGLFTTTYGSTLTLNPTQPFKGATTYYVEIPTDAILDASCDIGYDGGVSDSWRTNGVEVQAPTGPTYGSLHIDMRFDRPVNPGRGKLNLIDAETGQLITQVGPTDWTVQFKYNEGF